MEKQSQPLSEILNIGPDLAKQLTQNIDTESLAAEIQKTSVENKQNSEKNLQLQKDLLSAQVQALQEANFGSSASSLEQAASSLNTAADKITAAYSAGGFVPNYASVDGVERALRTERAMGAKRPVVDSHPSIGRYVRDAGYTIKFCSSKRDHPEGIKRATENSKNIQKAKAKGFTPNFFDSIFLDDSGEYNKVALASTGLFGLGYLAKKEFLIPQLENPSLSLETLSAHI